MRRTERLKLTEVEGTGSSEPSSKGERLEPSIDSRIIGSGETAKEKMAATQHPKLV
jgi:hypothetical protein